MASVPTDLVDATYEPRIVRPHLSFSQISMYLRCSMQYYFRYVLGLKQPPEIRTAVGKGGHSALEYNGRHKIRTGEDLDLTTVLDAASTFIDAESEDLENVNRTELGESKDRTIASLRVYHVRDAPKIKPAGVEVEFDLDLNPTGEGDTKPFRIVNGKIDLITTDSAVFDYKFVRQARTQLEVDVSPQLTLYGKVFQTLTGRFPRRLGYQLFLPGSTRTPPDSRPIERDPALMTEGAHMARVERLKFQFQQVEKAIRMGVYVPTDDAKTCSWCGYRDRCQSSLVDDFEAARIRGEG